MPTSPVHLREPPFRDKLPTRIFHRIEIMPPNGTYPEMRHEWGEFVYSFSGITEVRAGGRHILAPPRMGIWIPAGTTHVGFNRRETEHCSIYISHELCSAMPDEMCSILVTPLVQAMLDHLRVAPFDGSAEQGRLLRVLVDQLAGCRRAESFIPGSSHPRLGPLLDALRADPSDSRSIAALARDAHMSERSLMRQCRRDLGMSLTEWRQRVRVVQAMAMLQEGQSVESIALDLGYSTASAFIAMFKGVTGHSPASFAGR